MSLAPRAPVGVGVVGLGAIGRVHAGTLATGVPGARLVRVADAAEPAARAAGEDLDVGWSTSIDDLLADRRIDAVVIATPPAGHADQIQAAASAGKDIFCEKPLTLDTRTGCAAVETVRRAGVILQVGFQRRFDPAFGAVRRRLESGDLGRVRLYFSSMRSEAPPSLRALESGEHRLLFDAGCHELDAARWLIGEIDELTALAGDTSSARLPESDRPESAILALRFAGGTLGSIDLTYAAGYGFDCRCEVVAERASLRIDTPRADGPEVLTPGVSSRAVARTFLERFREAYRLELAGFVESILSGRPPRVAGEDGLAAQALCEAADLSRVEGRSVRMTWRRTASGVAYRAPVTREASREIHATRG